MTHNNFDKIPKHEADVGVKPSFENPIFVSFCR